MNWIANLRMALVAGAVLALDQASKLLVLRFLGPTQEQIIIGGFFKLVHWGNTGAAWSLFRDRNGWLATVSVVALVCLILWRHHFQIQAWLGQVSMGLIIGGIAGNLFDRIDPARREVIDFLRFYIFRRNGDEIGFPAFNLADSAICVGVGLLILLSWRQEHEQPTPEDGEPGVVGDT